MPFFEAREHEVLQNELLQKIDAPKLFSQSTNSGNISNVKAFGLNNEFDNKWRFSYYIGLDYLDDEKTIAVHVKPKIENLNYWEMLHQCLSRKETAEHASKIYNIRLEKHFIEPPNNDKTSRSFVLLIMHHFLQVLSELVKKPLIKSYVNRRENLKSKVKGKILLSEHIKKNIANRRSDRVMCSLDEYSADCSANRLLHSAYKICMDYKIKATDAKDYFNKYKYIETFFQHIGFIDNLSETAKIKTNPLYLEYKDALHLAKLIYQLKSYNEKSWDKSEFKKIPPYIINMPILFELYTYYLLLKDEKNVKYQVEVDSGIVDFIELDEKIIIDTKYKEIYAEEKQKFELDDIRQVSGYARDISLLELLYDEKGKKWEDWKDTVAKCLIIYPDKNKSKTDPVFKDDLCGENGEKIDKFNQIYKYGILLPIKE